MSSQNNAKSHHPAHYLQDDIRTPNLSQHSAHKQSAVLQQKSPGCYRCRQYKSKKSLIQSLFHSSLHLFHYILFPVDKKYGHYFLQNYSNETALFSQYKFSIIFVKYFCTKFPRKVDGTRTFFLFCYFLFSSRMTIISFIRNMVSFWGRIDKSSLSTRKTVI